MFSTLTPICHVGRGPTLLNNSTIQEIAIARSATPAQVILSWVVQNGIIVVPKSENVDRMAANLQVSAFIDSIGYGISVLKFFSYSLCPRNKLSLSTVFIDSPACTSRYHLTIPRMGKYLGGHMSNWVGTSRLVALSQTDFKNIYGPQLCILLCIP